MNFLDHLTWRFAKRYSISDIDVRVFPLNNEQTAGVIHKVETALKLIEKCDPRRWRYLVRDVKRILIAGAPDFSGCWHNDFALCELYNEFVIAGETTAAILAATIVHEAMHARLYRWGFGYSEAIYLRVERVCVRATIAFARRLPLTELASRGKIMAESHQLLQKSARMWSPIGRLRTQAWALSNLGVPAWVVHFLVRSRLTRIRRYRRNERHKRRIRSVVDRGPA
jgi:hypothetical protein